MTVLLYEPDPRQANLVVAMLARMDQPDILWLERLDQLERARAMLSDPPTATLVACEANAPDVSTLLHRIRGAFPGVPIVAYGCSPETSNELAALGRVLLLGAPFTALELSETLRLVVRQRPQRDSASMPTRDGIAI